MRVSILGTGRSIPERRLESSVIDANLGTDVVAGTGVRARFVCEAESQIELAAQAAIKALARAGKTPNQIDLIVSGSSVPFQPIPSTAPLVMRAIGVPDGAAAAYDVNSTCLSFVSALEAAARAIEGGSASCALVVSSEVASRALPWPSRPDVAAIFGDGAAAVVLEKSKPQDKTRIAAIKLRSYPSAYEACGIGAGGTRFDFDTQRDDFIANSKFTMDGRVLFRLTAKHFGRFVDDLLSHAGWRKSDVDLVVPHQASPAALEHMIATLGFERDRVVSIVEDFGNQIAASIPFALDVAHEEGRVPPGTRALLLGTSAGVSFGGAALVM